MAKKSYIGNQEGLSRLIPNKGYYGNDDNKSCKLLKGYIGNLAGLSSLFWEAIKKDIRMVFNRLGGFNYHVFTCYRTTHPDVNASWNDPAYTTYYAGDFGTAIRFDPYTCLNYIDCDYYGSDPGNMGFNNPIKYTMEYEGSELVYYLDIPGVSGGSSKWWLSIPTLLFGVSQVRFIVDGYNYLTSVWAGIAARRSDEGVETPYEYVQGAVVDSRKNVVVEFNADGDGLRADYIHIYAENILGLKTQLRIRQIIATYERTYGIVTQGVSPVSGVPSKLYLNYPKTGYQIFPGTRVEYNVVRAASAVWMLAFSSANNYTGDHVYADVDMGDYWGDPNGYRLFLFISKNPFTIKNEITGNTYTAVPVSYGGKTTYYFDLVFDYSYLVITLPLHSYAYTYYSNWYEDNPEDFIAKTGYVVLHSGLPIK